MIRIKFDAASVARVRVAASPVFEVVAWLCVAATESRHPLFGEPGPAAKLALTDPEVAATAALIAASTRLRYLPDFMTPKPDAARPRALLAEQLTVVRDTPAEVAAAQLPQRWLDEPANGLSRLDAGDVPRLVADGLSKFWRTALADQWPDLERSLSDHVRRCGLLLATGGVERLFNSLHPAIRWAQDTLFLAKPTERTMQLSDAEFVVIPSLLTASRLTVQLDDHHEAAVAFPAQTSRTRSDGPSQVASPLGRGRTAVLLALSTPTSTRELAQLLNVSDATVSHHLHALAKAGLAQAHRQGRRVVYNLTPRGRTLMSAIGPVG